MVSLVIVDYNNEIFSDFMYKIVIVVVVLGLDVDVFVVGFGCGVVGEVVSKISGVGKVFVVDVLYYEK